MSGAWFERGSPRRETIETVLITGANRGLGLALTQKFASSGWRVHAACRAPDDADALKEVAQAHDVHICQLEVTDPQDIQRLADHLADETLDVLINNAGILDRKGTDPYGVDHEEWTQIMAVNSIAPVEIALAMKPHLARSANPRIVTVSSEMGSLNRDLKGAIAYRASKAAVNKAMQVLATEFSGDGIIVVPIHPGWVQTDMGGAEAAITPEQSAGGVYALTTGLTSEMSGRFWTWEGTEHPW